MRREAKFNTLFNHWVKSQFKKTAAFELKQTKTDSLPFSNLQTHQALALIEAKHGTFTWKLPDVGYQNPFDFFSLVGVPAYVVIKYPEFFCMIDIDIFLEESKKSERRSLTSKRAAEIAEICVKI